VPVFGGDQLFVPSGRTPINTRAEAILFKAHAEMHAIDPDVGRSYEPDLST